MMSSRVMKVPMAFDDRSRTLIQLPLQQRSLTCVCIVDVPDVWDRGKKTAHASAESRVLSQLPDSSVQ